MGLARYRDEVQGDQGDDADNGADPQGKGDLHSMMMQYRLPTRTSGPLK